MNEPAERLFNLQGTAEDVALRRVRANGAHLTSFVSNVLTRTGEQRVAEIQLSDPITAARCRSKVWRGQSCRNRAN